MAIIASDKGGSSFTPIDAGMHQAVCYGVVDLGTHYNEKFGKSARKVRIMWEVPAERIEIERDGKKLDMPRVLSKEYTLSLGERANLRKDLQSWRGRPFTPKELDGFDISKLIGVNCAINVIHETKDGKTYANVSAITPLMKGMPAVKPENETLYFSFDDNMDIPTGIPDWLATKIKESDEYKELMGASGQVGEDAPDDKYPDGMDDVPF